MAELTNHLHRYTNFASALDILHNKRITVLSPAKWADRNDRVCLEVYQERKELGSLLALCFTRSAETAHHWSAFAPGTDGIRIELDHQLILSAAQKTAGFRMQPVEYRTIQSLTKAPLADDFLPFAKRLPYRDENEVRLIFESDEEGMEAAYLPIPLKAIHCLVLGPALPAGLADIVKQSLRSIPDCGGLRIHRTTLLGNDTWIGSIQKLRQNPATL